MLFCLGFCLLGLFDLFGLSARLWFSSEQLEMLVHGFSHSLSGRAIRRAFEYAMSRLKTEFP